MLSVVMLNVMEPENLAPDYQNFFLSFMGIYSKAFYFNSFCYGINSLVCLSPENRYNIKAESWTQTCISF